MDLFNLKDENHVGRISRRSPKWTQAQRRYIEWLASPAHLRSPPTEEELALELDRRPATLTRWRSLPGFQGAVDDAIHHRLLVRKANIFEVIGEIAEKGDIRHIKMALELVGAYPPPKPEAPGREPLQSYTAEEYAKAIEDVAAWRKKTFGLSDEEAWLVHP